MYLEYKRKILEEAKTLLTSKDNIDSDCISLYTVSKLLRTLYKKHNNVRKEYKTKLDEEIKKEYGWTASVTIENFDYKTKELTVGFSIDGGHNYKMAHYIKENDKLQLSKTKDNIGKSYFKDYEDIISNLYDDFLPFEDFRNINFYKEKITAVNSIFKANIYNYRVDIFVHDDNIDRIHDYFRIEALTLGNEYNCNSINKEVEEVFSNIEERYFKKVFVKIEDCPEWMQEELYKIRQEQLKPKEENNNTKKSEKKLIKKLFPFLNK